MLIGFAVTHSGLVWTKNDLWAGGGIDRLYIWQTYEVAKKLYAPRRPADVRIAILGNSRAWFPLQDQILEWELRRQAPDLSVRVDNLSIFGARVGDFEIISRHLDRLRPTMVVVSLGGPDIVATSWGKIVNPTGELLDIGWRDGPVPPEGWGDRVDRWLRTVWPLYRFRRFAREVVADRLFPERSDTVFPDHFASTGDYFGFVNGKKRGAQAEAAFQEWRRNPTLDGYVAFLGPMVKRLGYGEPVPDPATLTRQSLGVEVLDRLLERLAKGPWITLVVLMPENPLLDDDDKGEYHRPGFSDRAAVLIDEVAARHHVQVIDARRWMPAEAFSDFNHLFPDVSGFQTPLAKEILHALGS